MVLFEYENGFLKLNLPEILLVTEFNTLHKSNGENEEKSLECFKYIYLTEDWFSPYCDYSREEAEKEAFKDANITKAVIKSKAFQACKLKYKELQASNVYLSLLDSMYKSIPKFTKYFDTVDFTEKVTEGAYKGKMLYSPKEYVSMMKEAAAIAEAVKKFTEAAKKDYTKSKSKTRGDVDEGYFNEF